MPRKLRELIQDLQDAGFYAIPGGKGSHRKFTHTDYPGAVILSGKHGEDMKALDQYHKWVEWSDEDQTYSGKCPDLITGIHGDNPIRLYAELCDVVDEVIHYFQATGRALPRPRVRPMQEVA